uniref:DNA-directed DNA polymerase n=1 Tax=Globodera pallida TaxID=36090 RepID=A0A183CLX6_GLOPA
MMEELQRRGEKPKKIVQHGLRVYMLELGGRHQRQLICKDSLNYFHCALAALPETFGLHGVPVKPFFPYHYIHQRNLDVELPAGQLPPMSAYDSNRMKPAQRDKFLMWYEHELVRPGRQPFQLRRELLRYCWNGGLEPFLASTTIASLAMAVFRQDHLRADTMVQTPEGGFLRGRRASAASRRFFALLSALRPDLGQLQTAEWSIGEACVEDDGFRLDCVAYRHPPLRPFCIEYNGCYAHGCRECYPHRQMLLAGGRSAELLWARTQLRAWELAERHGMEVFSVWECQFKRTLRSNPYVRKIYTERCCADVPGPLDLRKHALFGGRVEPFYLLYSCTPDEEIVYIDIVSLYPYCMKTRSFPIGIPNVWTRDQLWPTNARPSDALPPAHLRPSALPWSRAEDNPFHGFLLCRVLPPTPAEMGDREPLLPYRTRADGRLNFGLCARCSEQQQQSRCRHTDRQRAWVYAYTHAELNKALELGYRVLDVFEVWHYEGWASPESENGLFTQYVNTFLRLKAEASGWPSGCESVAQREQHIRHMFDEDGIELRPERVRHNPGLRQLAKDLLNSLWGKMAQRPERDTVQYTDSARAFHALMEDNSQEVLSFTHINEHLDRCVVRKKEPYVMAPEHNNLAIACFVTSHARLCLYSWLEEVRRVGGRTVYCDTDSLLYVKKCGAPAVPEGNALGDMKREFPGRRIFDFFSAGPKNYGFRHVDARTGGDEKAERKIRSFELNYETSQLLQYRRMRQLVVNQFGRRARAAGANQRQQQQRTIAVPCHRFVRTRRADILTRHNMRVYRPVYTKGRVPRTVEEQPDRQLHQQPQQQQQLQKRRNEGTGTAAGAAAIVDHAAEAEPFFFKTRPFGWYPPTPNVDDDDDDDNNDDDEEEQQANIDENEHPEQMEAEEIDALLSGTLSTTTATNVQANK